MSTAAVSTLTLGSSPTWSWVVLVGLGLLVGLLLLLALVLVGASVRGGQDGVRYAWIGGLVALAGAGLLGRQALQQFSQVGQLGIEADGRWALFNPFGRPLAILEPGSERSLSLWLVSGTTDSTAYSDTLHGTISTAMGSYSLEGSRAFDLLDVLGYGPWTIECPNGLPGEAARLRAAGRRVLALRADKSAPLRLPMHRLDEAGRIAVDRHLAGGGR
jgi:hypothetical protein